MSGKPQEAPLRRRQATLVAVLFVGYFMYTAARRGVTAAQLGLESDLGFSRADIGLMHSSFSSAYGVSKFAGSMLTDFFSAGKLFAAGLGLAAAVNVVVGVSSSAGVSSAAWAVNGLVQGLGWPALSRLVLHWFPRERRGSVWSICTVSGNVARAASPVLLSAAAAVGGWRVAFYCPAAAAAVVSVACFALIRDSPTQEGLPPVSPSAGQTQPAKQGLLAVVSQWANVAKSLDFWLAATSSALAYFVLEGVSAWGQRMLEEQHSMDPVAAAGVLFWGEVGGIVATAAAGPFSDLVGGNRSLTSLVFFAAVPCGLLLLRAIPDGAGATAVAAASVGLALILAGANGPKTMCGLEVREKAPDAQGAAGALLGLVSQVGASASGYPLAVLQERYGWGATQDAWAAVSACELAISAWLLQRSWAAARARQKEE